MTKSYRFKIENNLQQLLHKLSCAPPKSQLLSNPTKPTSALSSTVYPSSEMQDLQNFSVAIIQLNA